jgi:hypothetical protein
VTVLGNMLFWSHIPFIQVLAGRLQCSAGEAGTLASSAYYGVRRLFVHTYHVPCWSVVVQRRSSEVLDRSCMAHSLCASCSPSWCFVCVLVQNLLGSLAIVLLQPVRIGMVFTGGMMSASAMLWVTASSHYWIVLLGLFGANVAGGLFGGTQATLVLAAVPPADHGLGMGLLTLAIGTVAFGDMLLGEVAEREGFVHTMVGFSALGCVLQLLLWLLLPECSRMRARGQEPAA